MPVAELKRLFGVKKVESYWIVHNKPIETIVAAGKMRIVISSFEDWYAGQFHYKKIDGPPPGAKWFASTLSVQEVADLLGICTASVYELMKKKPFKRIKVDNRTRIDLKSFNRWYTKQTHYPIKEGFERGVINGVNR